jgi:hypothetical protein
MTATVGPGSFTTTIEVLEASTKPPPSEVLALPPGFTKVDAPLE